MALINNTSAVVPISAPGGSLGRIDYVYLGVGSLSMLANLVVFLILVSDRRLFRKSAFIFCVTLGHVIGAAHLLSSSSYRLLGGSRLDSSAAPWDCVRQFWTWFYTYEFQAVGSLMGLIGLERLCAVRFPYWYRDHWTRRTSWMLGLCVFPCASIVMMWGFHWAWTSPARITRRCFQGEFWGMTYVGYCATVSTVGGTIGVVCTLVSFIHSRGKLDKAMASGQSVSLIQKQHRLTRTMLSISVLDFLLTVIPNSLLAYDQLNGGSVIPSLGTYLPFYSAIAYSINAEANLFAYLMFNSEFRKAAKNMVNRLSSKTSVVPMSTVN